jgi:hypothetical protein
MPDRFNSPTAASQLRRIIRLSCLPLFFTITMVDALSPVFAEIRVVTSQGQYRMGDRDTKEDAVRLATEAAKRHALGQVATYLESITIVEGVDVTKDEIRTYTAGLVLVLDQQTNLALDGDTVVVTVDLTAQVDTEEVARAIVALRENEDARRQLVALKEEIDTLQQELESANQALADAATAEQVQQAILQRQDILNRVQSDAIVAQAWTDWVIVSPVVYPYPWVGVAQATASLNAARALYPNSPHVQIAQHEMVTKQPPLPLEPTISTAQPVPQQPGSRRAPLTLNEISHTTPTGPPHLGNQPAGARRVSPAPAGSRTLTDIRQSNPLLTPPDGAPSAGKHIAPAGPRSAWALQQFLQPPAAVPQAGQSSVPKHLPPTINQLHPPPGQPAPHVPSRKITPRYSGGAEHHGGGRGGRGGGSGHGSGRGGKQ